MYQQGVKRTPFMSATWYDIKASGQQESSLSADCVPQEPKQNVQNDLLEMFFPPKVDLGSTVTACLGSSDDAVALLALTQSPRKRKVRSGIAAVVVTVTWTGRYVLHQLHLSKKPYRKLFSPATRIEKAVCLG